MLFFRLLEQAVATKPTAHPDLVATSKPKRVKPPPPVVGRGGPGSLARVPLDRPWRTADGAA